MTPRSVAIVGYSDINLKYLKQAQVDEIWTMNHHFWLDRRKPPEKQDLPRLDRLFELHRPEWFTRKEVPNAMEYRAWLQQPQPFPIYMLQVMEEFPSAILYPRDEIKKDVFQHLWRGDKNEIEYYTSSVGLMLAFAIHLNVQRIELYGVEMATDTEYADQKPAGEFMLGLAIGRGIDVVLHPTCTLCNAAVYGFEGVPHILRPRLYELMDHYKQLHAEADRTAMQISKAFNTGVEKDPNKAMEAVDFQAMYQGAIRVLGALMEEHDEYISAQFLEEKFIAYRNSEEAWKGDSNMAKAKSELLINQGNQRDAAIAWADYQDKRAHMMAFNGAVQVVQKLRDECRLKKPDHHLIKNIVG